MRHPREGSLRTRLAGLLAATVASAVLLMAGIAYLVVARQLERGQDVALQREATRIQRLVQAGSEFLASSSDTCRYASEPACTRLISASASPESGDAPLRVKSEAVEVARGRLAVAFFTVRAPGRSVRVVVMPTVPGEAVMVGLPITTVDITLDRIRAVLVVLGAVGVLSSALIGYIVAGVGLRPVRTLAAAIDRVARTRDPRESVAVERDDELGRLARSFSAMLSELAAANAAQQQLVADASHELRTPLTSLRTNFQLLERPDALAAATRIELVRAVDDELRALQSLVGDLIDLAHGDELDGDRVEVDLDVLLEAAVATAGRHWARAAFLLRGAPADGAALVVSGDPERLERLVSVLLDNAGKYSPDGGDVEVQALATDTGIRLVVADRGVGIPVADLPYVFDRFFRSPSARSLPGSGLGLAIADQIVRAHGGSIRAAARPGGGTIVTVDLPGA
ncbi:sensor histidine kinase [Frondihabitans cladoniiphilus]|uniref:histidine kinase n=1 Tax=Frondihabitans cladoniiphilus TaxID=715785 RepID=A0ABP8W1C3_9MICO